MRYDHAMRPTEPQSHWIKQRHPVPLIFFPLNKVHLPIIISQQEPTIQRPHGGIPLHRFTMRYDQKHQWVVKLYACLDNPTQPHILGI